MSSSFHSPIGTRVQSPGLEHERADERDASEDVWALAVAQAVVEHVPRLQLAAPPADDVGPEATSDDPVPGQPDTSPLSRGAAEPTAAGDAEPTLASGLPDRLTTLVSDSRLGQLVLSVARGKHGLDIVINVADAHVKALIEADRALLTKSLENSGLRVGRVEIGQVSGSGIALAPDRAGAERARGIASYRQPNARWRAYQGLEDEGDDTEGVDFTV